MLLKDGRAPKKHPHLMLSNRDLLVANPDKRTSSNLNYRAVMHAKRGFR
jgi:hypothetical protein